jgi:glycosyltransferase involved in cell wall biosynthesis
MLVTSPAESARTLEPVTVAIPHWHGLAYLPPAVRSVLNQTARNPLTVVIYNDDDWTSHQAVRERLGRLNDDPRVVVFTSGIHRGPYFAREVVRRASRDRLWATLDADDFVEKRWLERLIAWIERPGVVAATPRLDTFITRSMQRQLQERGARTKDGQPYRVAIYRDDPRPRADYVPLAPLSTQFFFRAHMLGVFDSEAVGSIGGFHGGESILWDRLMTNLLMMLGTVVIDEEAQYVRRLIAGSLTTSSHLRRGSEYFDEVLRDLDAIYLDCLAHWGEARRGRITPVELASAIRDQAGRLLSARERDELDAVAERLRERLASSGK